MQTFQTFRIYACAFLCANVSESFYVSTCAYVYMCVRLFIHVLCVSVFARVCIYMCKLCMYACLCINILCVYVLAKYVHRNQAYKKTSQSNKEKFEIVLFQLKSKPEFATLSISWNALQIRFCMHCFTICISISAHRATEFEIQ